jgi:putative DNA primase/helicase
MNSLDFDPPRDLHDDQYSSIKLGQIFTADDTTAEVSSVAKYLEELGANIPASDGIHPTAMEIVAGIAEAAEKNLIKAWRGNSGDHDFEPIAQSDGSWLTCCPAHNDHNPSFVATDSIDENGRPKLLITCRSGCSQDALIEALDDLDLWNRPPGTIAIPQAMLDSNAKAAKKPIKKSRSAIVPVPADAPPPPNHHPYLGPMTKRWEYQNPAGELMFYVCRFDPNLIWEENFAQAPNERRIEKPDHKTFRPLSYCKNEDGKERWSWVAPTSDIPLYNADKLAANPTARVIICEGEKAADAAQALFTDCVAVTWRGGAKAVAKAPWETLAKREVSVWPDHDEAGLAAAQAVVNELRSVGCASITMLDAKALASLDPTNPDDPNREPPPKWDAADALAEWNDHARLKTEVDRHSRALEIRERVELSRDNIGETVDAAEKVLLKSSLPIFKRGGFIVRAGQYAEKLPDGQTQPVLVALQLNPAGLGEALESVIRFEQYDARKKGTKPIHAPDLLLKTFLDRGKLSGLKQLTGVTDIPLIRADGTLLDVPGYDDATGIYYKPSRLALEIPENPTLDDAKEAIETLQHLVRDFPFEDEVDTAAAISAFVSAVNRPTLGPTPMYALTAPTPGTGKSLLASLITTVSTGNLPSYITQGQDEEELEKRVSAQMLAGRRVINIDNCDRPLKSSALCNLLTAESVSIRILGRSEMPEIASSAFILINGNNLTLANDMIRRTVLCRMDAKSERPEERAIGWDANAEARRNRGKYVSACLTIPLAYLAASAPRQTTPLGGFEKWSRRVRDPIIWAGLPDPWGNADKLRDSDPEKERFLAVAEQWIKHLGNAEMRVADVINTVNSSPQNEELKMALMNIAGVGRDINANRLAAYLRRYTDRPMAGFKFVSRKGHAGTKVWRLGKLEPKT